MSPDDARFAPIAEFARMKDIMARLRDRIGGCPWDLAQSFATIAPYTIEEAYEVADAAYRRDFAALKEELGDLCFQVFFHSQMAAEAGVFTLKDVLDALADKMIARHPHIFADSVIADSAAQTVAWEALKAEERARKAAGRAHSALDDIPLALPALARAEKLGKRAARTGFDWPDAESVLAKLDEEMAELAEARELGDPAAVEAEFGDALFVMAMLARKLGLAPEAALAAANRKFERRFRAIETLAAEQGRDFSGLPLAEQEELWREVKRREPPEGARS